jgi:hypothetical protein
MGHSIKFENFQNFILSEDEVRDFIEIFYRWGDDRFTITTNETERSFRGQHSRDLGGRHIITLVAHNIKKDFRDKKRTGGNLVAPTLKVAAGMVLAHELQHANQSKIHKNESSFYGQKKRYWNRACEREAREFVDNNMPEICAYFQAPWQGTRAPAIGNHGDANGEALAVAELLQECSEVTMDDIRDELRASKILNPKNVQIVVDELRKNKVDII